MRFWFPAEDALEAARVSSVLSLKFIEKLDTSKNGLRAQGLRG
jgi:hypothetical protein